MIALRIVSDLPIPTGCFYFLNFPDAMFFITLSLIFAVFSFYYQSKKQTVISANSEIIKLKKYSFLQISTVFFIILIMLWLPFYKFLGINNF